jgi:hypothetical protein
MKSWKPEVDHTIETAGNVTLPDAYDFLCEVWNKNPEERNTLIAHKVANRNGMFSRDKITLNQANAAIDNIVSIDIITPAYEIGYAQKDESKN